MLAVQNVGNAVGVGGTGVLFFGALHAGYAHAFDSPSSSWGWCSLS